MLIYSNLTHLESFILKALCFRQSNKKWYHKFVFLSMLSTFLIFTDVNECETGENSCDVNALCSNTAGNYVCRCIRGFVGDGKTCVGNLSLHLIEETIL